MLGEQPDRLHKLGTFNRRFIGFGWPTQAQLKSNLYSVFWGLWRGHSARCYISSVGRTWRDATDLAGVVQNRAAVELDEFGPHRAAP